MFSFLYVGRFFWTGHIESSSQAEKCGHPWPRQTLGSSQTLLDFKAFQKTEMFKFENCLFIHKTADDYEYL